MKFSINFLLVLMFTIPCQAIMPAKIAKIRTEAAVKKLKKEEEKRRAHCLDEWENQITYDIKFSIEKGKCAVEEHKQCFFNDGDYDHLVSQFRDAGYEVTLDSKGQENFTVDWCEDAK